MPEGGNSDATAVIVSPERFQLISKIKEDCVVQITNISFESVMFRVLTTAPQRYNVKPTKGVIKPNSAATVIILLNNESSKETIASHDDFRVEYTALETTEVIKPNYANVPDIIKAKKQRNKALVFSKTIRCSVSYPNHDPKPKGIGGATGEAKSLETGEVGRVDARSPYNSVKNQRELEQNTLAERNKREREKPGSDKTKMILLFGLVVLTALVGMWMMSTGLENPTSIPETL